MQTCWNPNVEHTDVDGCHKYRSNNHDHFRAPAVGYDDANPVDDDLEKELDLNTPPKQDCKVERET